MSLTWIKYLNQGGKMTKMKTRRCPVIVLLLLMMSSTVLAAFPDRPITYLIGFSPGGESDITARLQQKILEKELGTKIVITYKTAGGGSECWAELIRSKPDGYTIAGVNEPHTILQPLQRKDTGFQTKDLVRIAQFQYTPCVLIVKKDSPFNTLQDFMDYAKKKPGEVTIGGSGTWSATHLAFLLLSKASGIKATYIPFSGSGATKPALLGGHVMAIFAHPTMVVQFNKDEIKALALTSNKRIKSMSEVRTFKELGYKGVIEGSYRGVAAPPGTPSHIVNKLARAFKKVNDDPEYQKKMLEMGFDSLWKGPKEYTNWINKQIPYYKGILTEFGNK
jgi:tripartite-type tricarboxylate transporter receptor subunit TctC